MPSRIASSVMAATVWRCSGTMPMLEPSARADDRAARCLAVGRAGGDLRGWSERGIGKRFGCEEAGFGYNIHALRPAQSLHAARGVPMSSAWLMNPRNALLVVLALVALSYVVIVVRA